MADISGILLGYLSRAGRKRRHSLSMLRCAVSVQHSIRALCMVSSPSHLAMPCFRASRLPANNTSRTYFSVLNFGGDGSPLRVLATQCPGRCLPGVHVPVLPARCFRAYVCRVFRTPGQGEKIMLRPRESRRLFWKLVVFVLHLGCMVGGVSLVHWSDCLESGDARKDTDCLTEGGHKKCPRPLPQWMCA